MCRERAGRETEEAHKIRKFSASKSKGQTWPRKYKLHRKIGQGKNLTGGEKICHRGEKEEFDRERGAAGLYWPTGGRRSHQPYILNIPREGYY